MTYEVLQCNALRLRHFLTYPVAPLLALFCLVFPLTAQEKVSARFTYHRVICVVPLVSDSGTKVTHPDFGSISLNSASESQGAGQASSAEEGILAFYSETSDDGHWALAEIVAKDRSVLLPLLSDKRPGVWAVEKGTVPRSVIEAHLRQFKKYIDIDNFGAVVR